MADGGIMSMDVVNEGLISTDTVDQNWDSDLFWQLYAKPLGPSQNQPWTELTEENKFDQPPREGHDTSMEGHRYLDPIDWAKIHEPNLENEPDGTAVTTGQTEMGSRQLGDQRTTGQPNTNKSPEVDNKTNYVKNQVGSSLETIQNAKNCMEDALQVINAEEQHPQQKFLLIPLGECSKNHENLIWTQISSHSTHIPKPTGSQEPPVITYNPVSDGQPVNTDELRKDDRDLSQKRRVNPKRKIREEDALNKKCKEEEKKKKKCDYASNYRANKKIQEAALQERCKNLEEDNQRLQNELQILRKQNHTEDHFKADRPENYGVSESVPKGPPTTKKKSDERELIEMMNQAVMKACDLEKFLEFVNKWLSSKGMSEIRLNNEGPVAGVRFQESEVETKKFIIGRYRQIESRKKIGEDLARNGLD
ncbi:uncharacterized protein [Macrobrachium rosenbergii]|uniref:uncharacterized protein isoform X2 n=1 Tax=Macrobrachium rosenbergii TaxID=79674 RepID=UPI0034D757B4